MSLKVYPTPKKRLSGHKPFYNLNAPQFSSGDFRTQLIIQQKTNKLTRKFKEKILLVEDELAFQCLHGAALKKMGYELDLAENGKQAIELFQRNTYDLVLLDVGLPDISGVDVGRFIRTHAKGRHIPILALTGYGKSVEPQCLAVGFDEVLLKPIKLTQLEHILKENLKKFSEASS